MRRLTVVVLALGLISGCSSAASPSPSSTTPASSASSTASAPAASPSGPPVTISFLAFGDPEELQAYRNVISAYEALGGGTTVQLVEASDRADLLSRLSTAFAGGQPPDLFLINYRFYGQYAVRDVLEPLGDRIATSSAFKEEDFYEEALEAFRLDGKLICIPQNISSLVVYYNKDMFEAAGVTLPEEGWQFRDMVERAKGLTKDTNGDGAMDQYGLGVEASIIRLAPLLWSNGADIVDDPAKPTRLALDNPQAQQAMGAFFSLGRGRVIPTEQELESQGDEDRFLNGTTAMFLSSRRSTPTLRTITDFDWDIAALPIIGQPAGVLHSDAYCLPRAARHKEEAWRFLEFALAEEGQKIAAATGRTVPSLKSVANSPAFLDPNARPANSKVFLDTIPVIRRLPNISVWPEIESAMNQVLEQAMYEDFPPDAVAQQLDDVTKPIFARAEENR